jgi:hypothetical protein
MQSNNEQNFYTVQEVAALWKLSVKTVRRLVKDDPDTMKLVGPGIYAGTAKRSHITLRIPESTLSRMQERLTNAPTPVATIKKPRMVRRLKACA